MYWNAEQSLCWRDREFEGIRYEKFDIDSVTSLFNAGSISKLMNEIDALILTGKK